VKPGEYQGQDGRTYRWRKGTHWYFLDEIDGEVACNGIAQADWPASRAALDALIESEQVEWVEITEEGIIDVSEANAEHRIRRDGSHPQVKRIHQWNYVGESEWWAQTYRKGRSVALEQVQGLVEAVGRLEDESSYKGGGVYLSFGAVFEKVCEVAKKVKL
jgi:hypothetical protein